MRPIKSILVPVDFSEEASYAFRYALRLADHLDAGIDLLYVVPAIDGSFMSLTEELVENGKTKLLAFFTKVMSAASPQLEHVPAVGSFVEVGDLQTTIDLHVKSENNDLIVMGTHGEDSDEVDNIFGSNTSLMVSKAACPVLVIPKGFSFQPLHSICYATDLTHIDAFYAGHLLKVLRVFRPRLDFVHVKTGKSKKTEFNMDLLRDVFHQPATGIDTRFHVLEDDDVVEELFDFAEESKADLVVMYRPRRGWLGSIFRKSNTREAVLETTLPLLILPHEGDEEREDEA